MARLIGYDNYAEREYWEKYYRYESMAIDEFIDEALYIRLSDSSNKYWSLYKAEVKIAADIRVKKELQIANPPK